MRYRFRDQGRKIEENWKRYYTFLDMFLQILFEST